MEREGFFERVYDMVEQIPEGMVATYGQIARLVGEPRKARYVGFALHSNPRPGEVPCHRVVFADGSICEGFAFGGPEAQRYEAVPLACRHGVTKRGSHGERTVLHLHRPYMPE